jgi:hypothetical protein
MLKFERFGICNKGETATFSRGTKTFGSPFIYVIIRGVPRGPELGGRKSLAINFF